MIEVRDHLADILSPTAFVLYGRLQARFRLHVTEVDFSDAGELEQQGLVRLEEVRVNGRDMIKVVLCETGGL